MPEAPDRSHEDASPEPVHGRSRAGLYVRAFILVDLLIVLVALVAANSPGTVELSWVFGSGQVSIVWVIVVTATLGWLAGIVTGAIIRHATHDKN